MNRMMELPSFLALMPPALFIPQEELLTNLIRKNGNLYSNIHNSPKDRYEEILNILNNLPDEYVRNCTISELIKEIVENNFQECFELWKKMIIIHATNLENEKKTIVKYSQQAKFSDSRLECNLLLYNFPILRWNYDLKLEMNIEKIMDYILFYKEPVAIYAFGQTHEKNMCYFTLKYHPILSEFPEINGINLGKLVLKHHFKFNIFLMGMGDNIEKNKSDCPFEDIVSFPEYGKQCRVCSFLKECTLSEK
jgi:hypothetical protein